MPTYFLLKRKLLENTRALMYLTVKPDYSINQTRVMHKAFGTIKFFKLNIVFI